MTGAVSGIIQKSGLNQSEVDARVVAIGESEDWQSETEVDARVSTVVPTVANARTWNTAGLQDDEVAVIDFGSGIDGAVLIHENSNTPVANGFFTFNCATGLGRVTSIISNGITITTGALTGTTGTDGNITISAFENKLYLENRSGSQVVAGITVMSRNWSFALTSNSSPS